MGRGENDLHKGMSPEEEMGWRHSGNAAEWGVASSAGDEGREQLSWFWLSAASQKLPVWVQPPGLAMDMAPACLPACQPLLALADLPERT